MAKRFIDTNIWDKAWYMSLSCKSKCIARYLFERCDNAGIWEPNYMIASVHIGENICEEDILSIDSGKQFELLENGKIFIKDFCDFQYGELSENCKPHIPIIKRLQKHGLFERVCKGYSKGFQTLEEKDKEKEQDVLVVKNNKKKVLAENSESKKIKSEYLELQKSFTEKDTQTIGTEIRSFIEANNPTFAEPYVDAWNIFAHKNGLNKVEMITGLRRDKIFTRSSEPSFNFFEILKSAAKDKSAMGDNKSGWKLTFDYVINSEANYVKILEKKS
jgi:hypothetical protein